ncbi:MAG: hypothetical protein IJC83_00185 [Oscillospiraceae bacterium]|nr:hypothetical protein [Oscillospiraceae bacterium]
MKRFNKLPIVAISIGVILILSMFWSYRVIVFIAAILLIYAACCCMRR